MSNKASDDGPYRPSSEMVSAEGTTPSTRAMSTSTPSDAKVRVDKATARLTGTRCLITNLDCDTIVDYAHVLPCATKDDLMEKLEYSWGMDWATQNIHTRRNIFRLSAKFHFLFDAGKWLLLPDDDIIVQYEAAIREREFFVIKRKSYNYTLVAHQDMKEVSIHRRDEEISTPPGDFKRFNYPFSDFPSIVSHVHPRFVICNIGQKLETVRVLIQFAEDVDGKLYDRLMRIMCLYAAWKKSTPGPEFYEDKNESTAWSGHIRHRRKGIKDVHYAESLPSSTCPTLPKRCRPSHSMVDGTPSQRVLNYSSISESAKVRVDRVVAARCLIENTDKSNTLDYAHVVHRSTKDTTLTALEYSWGMPHNTFNVDTRHNIIRLSRNFHRLFDEGLWLLLPTTDIIEQYYKVKDKPRDSPKLDPPPYTYTMIANRLMEHVPIHAQRDKDENPLEKKQNSKDNFDLDNAFSTYAYPFQSFPPILSHVHPRFAIWNAGSKMSKPELGPQTLRDSARERRHYLLKVGEIYEAWITERLSGDFAKEGILPRDEPADDFSDDRTEPRRMARPKTRRARRPHVPGDGSPKSKKRAKSGGGKDSAWLDDVTLGELEPDRSPKEAWQDKIAWIETWVGQVPLDAMEEIAMDIDVADKSAYHTVDLDWEDMDSISSA